MQLDTFPTRWIKTTFCTLLSCTKQTLGLAVKTTLRQMKQGSRKASPLLRRAQQATASYRSHFSRFLVERNASHLDLERKGTSTNLQALWRQTVPSQATEWGKIEIILLSVSYCHPSKCPFFDVGFGGCRLEEQNSSSIPWEVRFWREVTSFCCGQWM